MTDLVETGFITEAYANWGRWVARCGDPDCPRAIQLRRLTQYLRCDFCRAITKVLWPSLDMITAVERLLMMRPVPSTRNWLPGETLHDLVFENGAHGIFDNMPDLEAPGTLFAVDDFGIRVDNLPALKPRIRKSIES